MQPLNTLPYFWNGLLQREVFGLDFRIKSHRRSRGNFAQYEWDSSDMKR